LGDAFGKVNAAPVVFSSLTQLEGHGQGRGSGASDLCDSENVIEERRVGIHLRHAASNVVFGSVLQRNQRGYVNDHSQGSTCDRSVQHENLCPTILDMDDTLLDHHPRILSRRGIADSYRVFAGRSLMPLCRGKRPRTGKSALSESFRCLCESPFDDRCMKHPWKETLRNSKFRYSVTPGRDEGEELFDLTEDPDELINVVHDPAYQGTRRELMKEMTHRVVLQEFPLPPRDLLVSGAGVATVLAMLVSEVTAEEQTKMQTPIGNSGCCLRCVREAAQRIAHCGGIE